MIRTLGSLGELFPDKDLRCRIRGCTNLWRFSGEEALRSVALGKPSRPERMCDECYAIYVTLKDKEVRCSRDGCGTTWTWNRFQQLEAIRQGRGTEPPSGLCRTCQQKLREVGDLEVPCRMKGCGKTWTWRARERLLRDPEKPPHRLCADCFEKLRGLQDQAVPCRMKGCTHTWTWNRFQQLEYLLAGKPLDCPPRRMCDRCFAAFQQLQDQVRPCKIRECSGTWVYTAYEQLERRLAAGLMADAPEAAPSPEKPGGTAAQQAPSETGTVPAAAPAPGSGPSETAPPPVAEAAPAIGTVGPEPTPGQEPGQAGAVPAAASGPVAAPPEAAPSPAVRPVAPQTAADAAAGPPSSPPADTGEPPSASPMEPPPPERLCPECFAFLNSAADVQVPCRNRGCTNTWTYTRAAQLRMRLKGLHRPPARMCDACQEKLRALQDREVKCAVPGCSRTWTYAAVDQLRDQLIGRIEPPQRRCAECEAFLAKHQTVTIPCICCGKAIPWSGYEQLLCELGTFRKPTHCLDCTSQLLALGRRREPERLDHHLVIHVPSAGRWHEDELIRDRPPRMTGDVLERMERAQIRIVCIGDEQTYSLDDEALSWPYLLQQRLCELYGGDSSAAVLNAGIAFCTTAQGVVRFPRDVVPFQPHLVVFSFSLADARLYWHREEKAWRAAHSPEEMMAAFERFSECLKRLSGKALYWTPNPIFPMEQGNGDAMRPSPNRSQQAWAESQTGALDQALRVAHQCCGRYGIPVLDVRARFEVNGTRSARKWMGSWYLHNELGARNIATWMAEFAVREGLLPPAPRREG